MRNVFLVLFAVVLIASPVFAGGQGEAADGDEGMPTYELTLGHTMPPGHPGSEAAEFFGQRVAELTDGNVTIDVFPAEQLGGAQEQIESTMRGTQDFAIDGPGIISQFYPRISVLDAPFMFASYDEFLKVYNSAYGQEFFDGLLDETGLRVLETSMYGTRQLTTNRAINSLGDLEGLKIRVPPVEDWVAAWRAIGANPTPIAFGEVYFSLQQSVVDAQENPLPTIYTYNFYEVQDYVYLTDHQIGMIYFLVNNDLWEDMPEAYQEAIVQAAAEASKQNNDTIQNNRENFIAEIEAAGTQVIPIDPDIRQAMKDRAQSIWPDFESKWGDGTVESIQAIVRQ